ncbi:ATP-binding protein [Kitasatospora nipponensis]|uniref:ATP-binding protein n=1 Tax=Kitasatospora nipponensis TaxID=258049 RepID=A0ABP4HMX6_9ACTN
MRSERSAPGRRRPQPGLPAGGQIRRLALPGPGAAVGRCRDFTHQALWDWRWLPPASEDQRLVAEDVLLLVSELVTNAAQHAGGARELVLRGTAGRLRVEVVDASPAAPAPRTPGRAGRPGGHGLFVVAALSREWGWAPHGPGKAVWLEVDSAADHPDTDAG